MCDVGYTVQRDLQRNSDLLFDLFGGNSRPLGDDLDVIVCHVWIGFDRKGMKREDTGAEKQERERHNKQTIA